MYIKYVEKVVLIVEDDDISRKILMHSIQRLGYNVIGAMTGREALTKAMEELPSVVFMDLNLPDISGVETTRRLREIRTMQNVPIIAITASNSAEDQEAAYRAGCDDYITKPADPKRLEELVDKVFAH